MVPVVDVDLFSLHYFWARLFKASLVKIQCNCGLFRVRQTSNCLSHEKSLVHVGPTRSYLTYCYFNKFDHYFNLRMRRIKFFLYTVNVSSSTDKTLLNPYGYRNHTTKLNRDFGDAIVFIPVPVFSFRPRNLLDCLKTQSTRYFISFKAFS